MGDPLLTLWSQTCKVHADTRHDEFKSILQAKEKFNAENWSHSALLIVVVLLTAIILAGGCICCWKFGKFLILARKLQKSQQTTAPNDLKHRQLNPPFNTVTIPSPYRIQEIIPNENPITVNV